jgi:isoquinoline 1-oxidoreductase beta subunit
MNVNVDRRALIGGAGLATAALVVPFAVTFSGGPTPDTSALGAKAAPPPPKSLGAYLQIDTANNVIIAIGSSEMGQGIMTGMAQLVAEELKLSWSQVQVVHAPASAAASNPYANPLFHAQVTGGSTSTRGWYLPMRQAAAIAGQMLISAATKMTPTGTFLLATGGKVTNGSTTYLFKDLVALAATLTPPASAPLATTNVYIGQRTPRTDIPAKVNGSAVYGIDVKVPGMLYGSAFHCPTLGGTVASLPTGARGAIAVVNLGNAVGVVSTDTWSAIQLARSIGGATTWTLPASLATRDSATILATANSLLTSASVTPSVYETTGSVDPAAAIAAARTRIDSTYQLPYLAHGCMEVMNCTASVTPTSCEIWAPTQGQQFCIYTAQALTGLPASAITVHTTYLGGGLGRKIEQDYVSQAILLSKAVGKPVKMVWHRTQDFQNDKYRPCASIRVQAGVDAGNTITGFLYRNVSPSIAIQRGSTPSSNPEDPGALSGSLGIPYNLINRRIEYVPNLADIPLGYWRSVGESYNTFAVESAIDELAVAAGKDPMAFRKAQVNDPRALGVLNAVDALSGWSTTAAAPGTGRGVAMLSGFGSYIALVAVVTGSTASSLRVTQVFCAIDCGVVVNPDSVEAQIQGGINHGVSATLWGQVTFVSGKPNVVNWSNYRVARFGDMPKVSVSIVSSTAAPGGVGETGVPCLAPAVANAFARLTGQRVRGLPFQPGATMGDG